MLAPRSDIAIEEAERLIYLEGELLDDWRLDDWLKLYTGDMTYLVPTPGMPMDCSPDTSLFLINDDRFPHGKPRQAAEEANGALRIPALDHGAHVLESARGRPDQEGTHVHGVFHVSRYRDGVTDIFMGRMRYRLVKQGDDVLIHYKRCDLGVDELVPQGRLTIIL
jgi:p-cumate 2,3-dioxygenase beta subunit